MSLNLEKIRSAFVCECNRIYRIDPTYREIIKKFTMIFSVSLLVALGKPGTAEAELFFSFDDALVFYMCLMIAPFR